jgi:predicted transcriptional regulator
MPYIWMAYATDMFMAISAKSKRSALYLELPALTAKKLDRFTRMTGGTKARAVTEALDQYLAWRIPQQRALKQAIRAADRGDFATRAEVEALFRKYDR